MTSTIVHIDTFLPAYHFHSLETLTVTSTPAQIHSIIRSIDFSTSPMIALLFRLRGLPQRAFTLNGLLHTGFLLLEEDSGKELVLGFIGQPWKLKGNLVSARADEFPSFARKGFVKVVWNFQFTSFDSNSTRLSTETRIYCMGRTAKFLFTLYWLLISPFSRLIRRHMLQVIKQQSEAA